MTVEHTGEWGPEFVMSWTVMDTWEVKTDGQYTITHTVTMPQSWATCQSRIRTPNGETTGPREDPSIAETTEYLTSGQIVEFLAYEGAANAQVSGTWTIMALAPLPENAITPDQIDEVYFGNQMAEALYYGETLVWEAVIRVTPPAPTFLDLPPWVELPEAEGVSYVVEGVPDAGRTVTVQAVAEDGYALEGVTEWTRTLTDYEPEYAHWQAPGRYNYHVPIWAGYIEVICLGGGGAGANGGGAVANAGERGNSGRWASARVDVRNLRSRELAAIVGAPGTHGTGAGTRGGNGLASLVVDAPTDLQVGYVGQGGNGGSGPVGSGTQHGTSPGNRVYWGQTYQGGAGGRYSDNSTGGDGQPPGGGGAGGAGGILSAFWHGGDGGAGGVWITARTRKEVEG